jgi:hypothetical protein
MAKSADVIGFEYKKHLMPGVETPATHEFILANSAGALTVGDAVLLSSGYLTQAAADKAIIGILQGFVTEKGENIFKTSEVLGGTLSGDDTYTAASDNTTVDKVRGVVIVDPYALFENTADSTLGQAEVGLFFNGAISDSGNAVDQVTGTGGAYSAGTQQFQLIELVTTDNDGSASTTKGLFRIARSQLAYDNTA